MNLDPQLLRVLESVTATYDFPIDWALVRRDSKAREASLAGPGGVAQVRAVEQHRLDVPGGVPDVRVYRPEGEPAMTIIHFHGGGWTLGDLDTTDHTARKICRQMGAIVISCTYRLAPENPFPTAFEDALAATRWALAHVEELGGDPQRVVIAGDSAGGNLVAAVTIALRDDPRLELPALRAQLLLYPGVDVRESALQAPSYLADLDPSTRAAMLDVCIDAYVQCGRRGDWRVSPLAAADLSCLPPALVIVLSVDPLRDQGVMYAERLQEAGVACELIEFPHLTHGFCHIAALVPAADEAFDEVLARFGQFVNFERGGN
jgi:acetyl esterase